MASVFDVLGQSEVPAHGPEEIAQYKDPTRKLEDPSLTRSTHMVHVGNNHSSREAETRSLEITGHLA